MTAYILLGLGFFQEFSRTNQDSYFFFKLTNGVLCAGQFSILDAGEAWAFTCVDKLLSVPVIDSLLADTQIFSNMFHGPAPVMRSRTLRLKSQDSESRSTSFLVRAATKIPAGRLRASPGKLKATNNPRALHPPACN